MPNEDTRIWSNEQGAFVQSPPACTAHAPATGNLLKPLKFSETSSVCVLPYKGPGVFSIFFFFLIFLSAHLDQENECHDFIEKESQIVQVYINRPCVTTMGKDGKHDHTLWLALLERAERSPQCMAAFWYGWLQRDFWKWVLIWTCRNSKGPKLGKSWWMLAVPTEWMKAGAFPLPFKIPQNQ